MITTTKAFQTEDGSTFANIEDAQKHQLTMLPLGEGVVGETFAETVMEHKDAILAIFSSCKAGRPRKARKVKKQVEQPAE